MSQAVRPATPLLMGRRRRTPLTAVPLSLAAPHNGARSEAIALLDELDQLSKRRTSAIRTVKQAGAVQDSAAVAKDLLAAVTDQRKRVRAIRRVWEGLGAEERPDPELVSATARCRDESEQMGELLRRRLDELSGR